MALINRISQLFRADMHAVLDQMEEPEVLLKQAIREMEADLDSAEHALRAANQEQRAMKGRLDALDGTLGELEEHLDICFESQEHDLAKDLTRKKLETQRLYQTLQNQIQTTTADLVTRESDLAEKRSAFDGLRQKAEVFAIEKAASSRARDDSRWNRAELNIAESEVEAAFLKELKARAAQ